MPARSLKESEINHLRRLIAYVKCDIGEDEQKTIQTYSNIIDSIQDDLSDDAKERIVDSIKKSASVPQYIRRAIKALDKVVKESGLGDIVDAELASDITEIESRNERRSIKNKAS